MLRCYFNQSLVTDEVVTPPDQTTYNFFALDYKDDAASQSQAESSTFSTVARLEDMDKQLENMYLLWDVHNSENKSL